MISLLFVLNDYLYFLYEKKYSYVYYPVSRMLYSDITEQHIFSKLGYSLSCYLS